MEKEIKKQQNMSANEQVFPQDKDKSDFYKPTKKEKEVIKKKPMTNEQKLTSMRKDEQVRHLLNYGLSKKEIRELRYEANRVKKLMEFAKTDRKVDSLMVDFEF